MIDKYIGKMSGYLKVIERDYEKESQVAGGTYYKCLCTRCGRIVSKRASKLNGRTEVACKWCAKEARKELFGDNYCKIEVGQIYQDYKILEYIPSTQNGNNSHMAYVVCQCIHCGIVRKISVDHIKVGEAHCSCQTGSQWERQIGEWLIQRWGLPIRDQFPIGGKYRMDFAIIGKDEFPKMFIEYDGEFHDCAERVEGGLELTQQRDEIKNQLAADMGVPLLRIHHSERSELTPKYLLKRMESVIRN